MTKRKKNKMIVPLYIEVDDKDFNICGLYCPFAYGETCKLYDEKRRKVDFPKGFERDDGFDYRMRTPWCNRTMLEEHRQ